MDYLSFQFPEVTHTPRFCRNENGRRMGGGRLVVRSLRRVGHELATGQENAPRVYVRVKDHRVIARLARRHPARRIPVTHGVVEVSRRRVSQRLNTRSAVLSGSHRSGASRRFQRLGHDLGDVGHRLDRQRLEHLGRHIVQVGLVTRRNENR